MSENPSLLGLLAGGSDFERIYNVKLVMKSDIDGEQLGSFSYYCKRGKTIALDKMSKKELEKEVVGWILRIRLEDRLFKKYH